MTEAIPCAWWLVPEHERHVRLSRWIGTLAAVHGGPVFEPHLTLALSTLPAGVEVSAVQVRLAAAVAAPGRADGTRWAGATEGTDEGLQPLVLHTVGLGHDAHYFQAFHLRMAATDAERAALAAQVQRLHRLLGPAWDTRPPVFAPHLSLAYGEWSEERRQQQVRDTPIDPELARIRFDTLVGVRPRAGVCSLERVADWEIFLRLPLIRD